MKLTPEDPTLTAYVVGELNEPSRSQVAKALAADEELQQEEVAISSLASLLSSTLGGASLSLGDERIAEIHKSGQRPDSKVLVLDHRKRSRRQSFAVVCGVAAVVVIGFVALSRFEMESKPGMAGGEVAGGGSGSGGAEGTGALPGDSPDLPGEFSPAAKGAVGLPLMVKKANPSLVEIALEETGSLPARDQFLVADWVNLGESLNSSQVEIGNLGVSFELGPCSWNPTASLLMVNLRSLDQDGVEVEASLVFDSERVREAGLMGGSGEDVALPAVSGRIKAPKTFLYEIDLLEGEGEIGSLQFKLPGQEAAVVPLAGTIKSKDEVSSVFATAAILGDYARWAASENRDRETLVRLAREAKVLLGKVTDGSTRYALDMILLSDEALKGE